MQMFIDDLIKRYHISIEDFIVVKLKKYKLLTSKKDIMSLLQSKDLDVEYCPYLKNDEDCIYTYIHGNIYPINIEYTSPIIQENLITLNYEGHCTIKIFAGDYEL